MAPLEMPALNGVGGRAAETNGGPAPAGSAAGSRRRKEASRLTPADAHAVHDLICVGFGPASLAIAVALHDALEAGSLREPPRVLFLEKQTSFAWHAGMLLPGAKMQISFLKDLATLRDPRSNFTFLNYLRQEGRLVEFTNLSTFLPSRSEYEEYLRWCARFFDDVVRYGTEVLSVARDDVLPVDGAVTTFRVVSKDSTSGELLTHRGRNVLVATGGQPAIPRCLPSSHPKVIHSSQYAQLMPRILQQPDAPYRIAVVGAGQSAAEIFSNIQILYPNAQTYLVMRSEFLKPSDDSPFVNSIFNPDFIDTLYPKPARYRQNLIADARATNYGVVRLELIENLYELMYDQRRRLGSDESAWPHRIMGGRRVVRTEEEGDRLRLVVRYDPFEATDAPGAREDVLDVDMVVAATGYRRTAHVDLVQDLWSLLPEKGDDGPLEESGTTADGWCVRCKTVGLDGDVRTSNRMLEVGRDYQVKFSPDVIAPGSGIWLQGCCEGTHGLSDTLLSVLATRSGEIVESIFSGIMAATH